MYFKILRQRQAGRPQKERAADISPREYAGVKFAAETRAAIYPELPLRFEAVFDYTIYHRNLRVDRRFDTPV